METLRPTASRCLAIVDDDRELLDLMGEFLTEFGWRIVSITSAADAFAGIVNAVPDAILLDLHLESPGSGWRVREQLEADPRTHDIPVIIWSADVREIEEKREWMEEQKLSVLTKPFELDDVIALLDGLGGHDEREQRVSSR
jgi:CheY-like chemotaxis protein